MAKYYLTTAVKIGECYMDFQTLQDFANDVAYDSEEELIEKEFTSKGMEYWIVCKGQERIILHRLSNGSNSYWKINKKE